MCCNGCGKRAEYGGVEGLCVGCGGGRRCQQSGCTTAARCRTDVCSAHGGGGRRYKHNGCTIGAQGATHFCAAHGEKCKGRASTAMDRRSLAPAPVCWIRSQASTWRCAPRDGTGGSCPSRPRAAWTTCAAADRQVVALERPRRERRRTGPAERRRSDSCAERVRRRAAAQLHRTATSRGAATSSARR